MTLLSQAFEFRSAYEVTNENSSHHLQKELIREEYKEFMDAYNDAFPQPTQEEKEHLLKELGDLVFVCYQFAACMGWDLDEAMNRIFLSNMSKLGEDGKPIRSGTGKVLKGPNYAPPNLSELVS
jgi:predicted HAD superfamily Cof-like phosphohydrolase